MTDPSSRETRKKSMRIRPYLRTGGRTSTSVELPLETLLIITESGRESTKSRNKDARQILALAQEPVSIAEVSAHLSVPLQTAKILVGDLVTSGDISTHSLEVSGQDDRPDLLLLERVLDGLQNL